MQNYILDGLLWCYLCCISMSVNAVNPVGNLFQPISTCINCYCTGTLLTAGPASPERPRGPGGPTGPDRPLAPSFPESPTAPGTP